MSKYDNMDYEQIKALSRLMNINFTNAQKIALMSCFNVLEGAQDGTAAALAELEARVTALENPA